MGSARQAAGKADSQALSEKRMPHRWLVSSPAKPVRHDFGTWVRLSRESEQSHSISLSHIVPEAEPVGVACGSPLLSPI